MKITRSHLTFYANKKFRPPGWAKDLEPAARATIDQLINVQVPRLPYPSVSEPHNTINLLKFAEKHGYLLESLTRMAAGPQTRRQAYCREWLRRIKQ